MWLYALYYSKSFTRFSGKKELLSQVICNFFFKMFQMGFSRFSKCLKNNMKFTWAVCWINSEVSKRDKNITLIIFFCHCCWSLLWCSYWKFWRLDSHLPETLLYLLQWKPFKNDEKCFLFHLRNSPCSQDM